jgi:hypothetical protein
MAVTEGEIVRYLKKSSLARIPEVDIGMVSNADCK